jgi:hypothetical protein
MVTDVHPALIASIAIVMAIVVLMVHANLRHDGIVHRLDAGSAPVMLFYATVQFQVERWDGLGPMCLRWAVVVFLAKAVPSSRTADCMHDKQWEWFLVAASQTNPAPSAAAALEIGEGGGLEEGRTSRAGKGT